MEKILLLGNGLNNLTKSGTSWFDIIRKKIPENNRECFIEKDANGKENLKPFIPYPFIFDLYEDVSYQEELKKTIEFPKFGENVLDLYDTILTTNFTTELEKSKKYTNWKNSTKKETKYNLFRKTTCENKTIWYIHGSQNKEESIVMGQNKYLEQIGKMASYINGKYKFYDKDEKAIPSIAEKLNEKNFSVTDTSSWIDYFFMPNCRIDILGFSFSFSELDLWYILKKRRELKDKLKNNEIVYHSLTPGKKSKDYDDCKIITLETNNVSCITYARPKNDVYLNFYKTFFDQQLQQNQ